MADMLAALRSLMSSHSPPLNALVVPSEDYHQSEYVSSRDKRREFVSEFTGSAGLALITMNEALLWTDARYFLQAAQQLSDQWKLMRIGEDPAVDVWMADNLPNDASIGIDPWCVSIDTAQRWERAFAKKKQKLVHTSTNVVDEVWKNRPPPQINAVNVHALEFAGRSIADKLNDLRERLTQEKVRGIVIAALDEARFFRWVISQSYISDVSYCPVVHAFAIVTPTLAFIYVDQRKLSSEVSGYLKENGIEVREYGVVSADVSLLASNQLGPWEFKEIQSDVSGRTDIGSREDAAKSIKSEAEDGDSINFIWANPGSCCYALYSKLDSDRVLLKQSPLALAKALKNPIELDGLRKAHIRDGAAVVQYLVWLDKQMQEDYGASGYFVEGETLAQKKKLEGKKLMEVTVSDKLESFRASKEKALRASGSGLYPGYALDILARLPLYKDGLNYRHGTGHGIGSYLNVHEGPHSIGGNEPIQASMTVTDEPGYYEDGNFGVRLENVLVVNEADTKFNFGDKGYLSFEHITWALYQSKLIDLSLLMPEEIDWLNTYHSKCRETLAPYLDDAEMAWLKKATKPVCA
ncbi:hypothetical protein NL676_014503 [Syzygium grande]|nr:hypothetical protein NL676_014503 [Syzygium grande]